jgi:hypothetical protein
LPELPLEFLLDVTISTTPGEFSLAISPTVSGPLRFAVCAVVAGCVAGAAAVTTRVAGALSEPSPYAIAAADAPTSTTNAANAAMRRLEELNMSYPFFEFSVSTAPRNPGRL